jgi:fibronectin-binding autotransporter adhesin
MKPFPAPRCAILALLSVGFVVGCGLTRASVIDWGNTGPDFNTGGDWVGGTAPGSGDIAEFNSAKSFDPNLSASLTIQGLTFTADSYTLTSTGGATLTLTNTGSNDTAQTSAILGTVGGNDIKAPIVLGGAAGLTQSISAKAGAEIEIDGTITNTNAITLRLAGGGTIYLTADNSATLNAPIDLVGNTALVIGNDNALGSGVLSVLGGGTTIYGELFNPHVLPNALFDSANVMTFSPGSGLTFLGGMTQDADQTVVVNSSTVTVSSLASNTSALRNITKEGPGALLVTGNRTQGGMTKVTDGTFGVAGSFTSQDIILNGGVLGLSDSGLGGPFTRALGTTNTTMRWTQSGGFAAYGSNPSWGAANNLTVNIGGAGATLTWGATSNFLASGQFLILGSTVSNGTVNFQNGLNFGASDQIILVNHGATGPIGGGAADAVISGIIGSSGGGLAKEGFGTLVLTGNNTYSGPTNVNAGTLLVDGNQSAATGAVTVNGDTALGGSGIIGGSVTVFGTLGPGHLGNSTGILTTGSLSLTSNSTFLLDLNNTVPGTGYDQVIVNGTVTLNLGNIVVKTSGGLTLGEKFYVVLNDSNDAVTGSFTQGTTVTSGVYKFTINYSDNGDGGQVGNDISLTVAAVPEPSTWALMLIGFASLITLRILRRSRPCN